MGKPTGFIEFTRELPTKRAPQERIKDYKEFVEKYSDQKLKEQSGRCMNCGVPFCHNGCPLGNIIPEFNDAVYNSNWEEAYELLSVTNNFPEFTGRICPAPCESACVLGINQPAIAIEEIEKHIIEIAFEKGMLLVNSAGNDGNNTWEIVGAPADAAGVFTIGAVDASGDYASFSSIGSAIQPTQKPDVVAQGLGSAVIDDDDALLALNGTSFSSPILAGGIACLWQALPNKTNAEIMQLVRASASQFNTPDYFLGYGIPNLQLALNNALSLGDSQENNFDIKIFPNPVSNVLNIAMPSNDNKSVGLFYNILGKKVLEIDIDENNSQFDISFLSRGLYLLKIESKSVIKTFKIVKN